MDFFGAQDRARQKTGRLVFLFGLAVCLIVAVIYLVLSFVLFGYETGQMWDPVLLAMVTGAVLIVVFSGSFFRTMGLRKGGGRNVAEALGGRPVLNEQASQDDRRLLNVVEEMALASGMPVPAVYILEGEAGINAFAAGYSIDDAVVAVTRGALHQLTRDELQAVIAHEFSHIANRDMRLNIQLMGIIFGILVIGVTGRILLRSMRGGGGRNKGAVVIFAIGLVSYIAGYAGVLVGRLIQSAVSRQREFLADAAAVQFTRNPEAMASTLKKIAGIGSKLDSPRAEEMSHFFFASGLSGGLTTRLWATHPPIAERIRRLDPYFDLKIQEQASARSGDPRAMGFSGGGVISTAPDVIEEAEVRSFLEDIPDEIIQAAHDSYGASALMLALIMDPDEYAREEQQNILMQLMLAEVFDEVTRLQPIVDTLPQRVRLPVADIAAPALAQLSVPQAQDLATALAEVVRADKHVSLFEFALETIVLHRLKATHGNADVRTDHPASVIRSAVAGVISALALAGHGDAEARREAYLAGARRLGRTLPEAPVSMYGREVVESLEVLADSPLGLRESVLDALLKTAHHDGSLSDNEVHLLHAFATLLRLPPPTELGSRLAVIRGMSPR